MAFHARSRITALTVALALAVLTAPLSTALVDVDVAPGVWRDRSLPTGRDVTTTWWFDAAHGIVAGTGGRAYATTDAGVTWDPLPLGFRYDVADVFFLDDARGVAVDAQLAVAVTEDGGASWSRVSTGGAFGTFRDAWFTTPEHGVVGGALATLMPAVYRTTDGGRTWDVAELPEFNVEGTVQSVFFVNEHVGYATGRTYRGEGFVWKTVDGGNAWSVSAYPLGTNLAGVAFTDADTGVVVGALGSVHRTTDGGASWTLAPAVTAADLKAVDVNADGAFAAFGLQGGVVTSADGLVWAPANAPASSGFRAGALLDDGTLAAVGDAGAVWVRPPSDDADSLLAEVPDLSSPHPPIMILGDDGFHAAGSGVTRGNGTADDPFVIEGLDIVPSVQDGITLVNTRAHVVIRDNVIHDGLDGRAAIHLVNARNVRVEANLVQANDRGVVAEDARDVTVHANVFERQGAAALDWTSGSGLTVTGNAFRFTAGTAARVTGAPAALVADVTIADNAFQANGVDAHVAWTRAPSFTRNAHAFAERTAVLVDESNGARVTESSFTGAGDADVHVLASADALVAENAFAGGSVHVLSERSARVTVTGNAFNDPEARGVLAQGGRDVTVTDNRFVGSATAAVFEHEVRGVTFTDNVIDDSWFGVSFWNAHDALVARNAFTPRLSSVGSGDGSTNLTVHANHFSGYGGDVSFGTDTASSRITGNVFENVSYAIGVTAGARDILVEGNTLVDAQVRGISVSGPVSRVTVRENTLTGTHGTAIGVVGATTDVLVASNHVTDVTGTGVGVRLSGDAERARVTGNVISGATHAALVVQQHENGGVPAGTVDGNTLAGNARAVSVAHAPGVAFTGNDFSDAAIAGLEAAGATGVIDARGNWWGDATGPSGDGPGAGSAILTEGGVTVNYSPWLASAP